MCYRALYDFSYNGLECKHRLSYKVPCRNDNGTPVTKPAADDPPLFEDFLPYVLLRLSSALNQKLAVDLAGQHINIARWRVLAVLMMRDGQTIGAMAQAAMIEQSALSRTVTSMEREGLVERRAGHGDQRFVEVWLRPSGRDLFDRLYPIVTRRQYDAVAGLNPKEQADLLALLARVFANVTAHGTRSSG